MNEDKPITDSEIKEYFAKELYDEGFIPTDYELDVIADIAFDFMVDKKLIIELEDEEE